MTARRRSVSPRVASARRGQDDWRGCGEARFDPLRIGPVVRHARADRTKGRTGLTTEAREELAQVRKDNRELRMEPDILKKAAAAFCAKHQA
jgi:hypothetical protein